MFQETIEKMSTSSLAKANLLKGSFVKYFILAMMAGFYVGLGIFLIQSIGAPLAGAESPFTKLLMGVSFSIALTLVVFAGAELFTGNVMVMTVGRLNKKVTMSALLKIFLISYIGNLAGSIFLSYLIDGTGLMAGPLGEFIISNASAKMEVPAMDLFFRGILCNMLVCLAIWMGMRTTNDVAKYIFIFLCLFAFISCGYEHSVANMTLLYLGVLAGDLSLSGYAYNLAFVTLGNMVGGGLLVGAAYWFVNSKKSEV